MVKIDETHIQLTTVKDLDLNIPRIVKYCKKTFLPSRTIIC